MTRLKIATNLNDRLNAAIAAHPSAPQVVPVDPDRVWDVPVDVDILVTYQKGWHGAPTTPPTGWPGTVRWVQTASSGVDAFPDWVFEGPVVTRGGGILAPAMGEYVLAAIMAHEKRLWDIRVTSPSDWKHADLGVVEGKTVAILGFGYIGKEVARRALAQGMRVMGTNRSGKDAMPGVEIENDLAALVAAADHLVIALPLTPQTEGMINEELLRGAKATMHLINVARGGIVDDAGLVAALDKGLISAATLDVTNPEPLPEGHAFYSHPRIRLTPHVSGIAENTEDRVAAKILGNLDRFIAGQELEDLVQRQRGY